MWVPKKQVLDQTRLLAMEEWASLLSPKALRKEEKRFETHIFLSLALFRKWTEIPRIDYVHDKKIFFDAYHVYFYRETNLIHLCQHSIKGETKGVLNDWMTFLKAANPNEVFIVNFPLSFFEDDFSYEGTFYNYEINYILYGRYLELITYKRSLL